MSAQDPLHPLTVPRAHKRPFLLTSAWARVAVALGVSLGLWILTGWALGWGQ